MYLKTAERIYPHCDAFQAPCKLAVAMVGTTCFINILTFFL